MSCRVETANTRDWRFCPDEPPPAADLLRAILRARLVDEITQEPIEVDLELATRVSGASVHGAAFGRVGLVGRPARLFPGLALNPVELDLRVRAHGYLPLELAGTLGPIAGFPDQFASLDLGDAGLHRIAVSLRGRTVQRTNPDPVDGASVSVAGYWPVFPPADVSASSVMLVPDLVSVAPGVYRARAAAATTLRSRAVPALPGEDKLLLLPVVPGSRRLRLSNRSALAVGSVLVIDPGDPGRRERIPLEQVDTGSSDDQPAWVVLAHPLAWQHREGVICQVGDPQALAAVNTFTRDTIPGDQTVFLDGLAGLADGAVVEIDDGTAVPEYQEIRLYEATSDTDGYFRLPPLARVAMVLLNAQRGGLTPPDDMPVAPDYRVSENRLTVTFP